MAPSNPNPLEQLLRLEKSSTEFDDKVSNILHGKEYQEWVRRIQGNDVGELVGFLDSASDILDPANSGFRRCLRELRRICGSRLILPESYQFPPQDLTVGRQPVASGGSGDVYKGTLNGSQVCVKRVRVYLKDGPEKAKKALYQEAVVWKRLNHKNILPLLGLTIDPLQLISEWMSGGDLTEYITQHPDQNPLPLICGIAEGLLYLHSYSIVHGDLKGPNVLVDQLGHARIADFGLATVTQNLDSIRSVSGDNAHTARWTAPEILNEEGTHSKEADVFSFAMVMIEAFTGAVPFKDRVPAAAMLAIMNGQRPPKPSHPKFRDNLWALMQKCWGQDPHLRPDVLEILKVLNGTEPPRPRLYLSAASSASVLTVAQQPQFAALSNSVARRPPSLGGTVSSVTQNSSHRSEHSTPVTPVSHVGDIRAPDSHRTRLHGSSQATIQDPASGADRHRSDESRGPQHIVREISRMNTNTSEPSSPFIPDPQTYLDLAEQSHGQTAGVEMLHTDPTSLLPPQHNQSRTILPQADKSNSRLGIVDTDDGKSSRRPSRRGSHEVNGHATGNTSHHDLAIGAEPHGLQELPLEGKDRTELRTRGINVQEPVVQNPPKEHGPWCRFKSRFKSLFRFRTKTN